MVLHFPSQSRSGNAHRPIPQRVLRSKWGFANTGAAPVAAASDHEHLRPTPRIDLTFQMDSQNFFYAALAKGFRSGGSNGLPTVACPAGAYPTAFAPDSVWSFEIGAKNQLFDDRLQLNASVYDIHWNNIQESVDDACGNRFTINSGAARSTGFDINAEALLTDRLRLSMAVWVWSMSATRAPSRIPAAPSSLTAAPKWAAYPRCLRPGAVPCPPDTSGR